MNRHKNGSARDSSSYSSLDFSSIDESSCELYSFDNQTHGSASTRHDAQEKSNSTQKCSNKKASLPTIEGKSDSVCKSRIDDTEESGSDKCVDIEGCITNMISQRDNLRKRFKEWSTNIGQTIKRLRSVTDNTLVNQNVCLERILSEGKARVDEIEHEQDKIRSQLSSFVSMLSNAQSQIFAECGKDASLSEHTLSSPTSTVHQQTTSNSSATKTNTSKIQKNEIKL
ncbi:hypothetical protein BX070DRAFT_57206 [Coemansia spiralis]|uniref:Uncharacterized protein n=1 Tax=Coemansia umbellata TaxID=1424467 RepID=A0ABQ8PGU2_9FUNG|nr:hypothetical protein BX070DRAFT_57206 [Coemansia spiralis]KAJ1988993.1 hypothetical protein EDC05_004974 [Coemansia umbellata]